MYIARRTGGGRGVYEVAGQTATGLQPTDLVGRHISFEFDDGLQVPLGLSLQSQGGKPRLILESARIHVQRQLAAILLLPKPRRDNKNWSEEYGIPSRETYVIEHVQLAFVNHVSSPTQARIVPDVVNLRNAAGNWFISVDDRLWQIQYLWSYAGSLPENLRELVAKHQQHVTAGEPIPNQCESVVTELIGAIDAHGDPLPTLISLLENHIDEKVEERVWKQITQRRGQRHFREALIESYQGTCQVTEFTGVEALEAAHIVPYASAQESANDPANGLLLRADIHTLFDLDLLKVDPDNLRVRIMEPLHNTSYMKYHDTSIRIGAALEPSRQALAKRWGHEYHAV